MMHPDLFAATWDQKLTFITVVTSALLLAAALLSIWAGVAVAPSGIGRGVVLLGGLLALTVFVLGILLAPRGYAIEGGLLKIDRRIGPVEIPLDSIRTVETLPAERLAGSLRTLGSGGFFGYYGRFRNQALGSYRMYATRGDGYVLVRGDATYVLTPDSPERFIEAFERNRGTTRSAGPGGIGS